MAHKKHDTGTIRETATFAVGALAARDLVGVNATSMTQGGHLISTTLTALHRARDADDGPLLFGIADQQLSDAEVEEAIETEGPFFATQRVQNERASRPVRVLGLIEALQPSVAAAIGRLFLKNASVKLSWTEGDSGGGWKYWVYNPLASGDFVAGSQVDITAEHFVRWNSS